MGFSKVANCDLKRKGASIKDLGKKWFAVSLMEAQDADEIIDRLRADAISVSY